MNGLLKYFSNADAQVNSLRRTHAAELIEEAVSATFHTAVGKRVLLQLSAYARVSTLFGTARMLHCLRSWWSGAL